MGDSTTAFTREQLFGHFTFPATKEHATVEDTFSEWSMLKLYNVDKLLL
jgi:hypothetical protein